MPNLHEVYAELQTTSPVRTVTLELGDGSLTLDSQTLPFLTANLTITTPDPATLLLLDPSTAKPRVTINGASTDALGRNTFRTFDCLVTGRAVDHNSGSTTLTLVSDDQRLVTYISQADDLNTYLALQHSVRSIVQAVVTKVAGKTLATTETADADFTIQESATNLITNPSFEAGLTGGSVYGGSASVTVSRQGPFGAGNGVPSGQYFMRGTYTTNGGGGGPRVTPVIGIDGNTTYVASAWVRSSRSIQANCIIEWFDSNSAGIVASYGQLVNLAAGVWTRVSIIVDSPATAAIAAVDVYAFGTPFSSGDTFDMDAVCLAEAEILTDYFDGSTPSNANFAYSWTGTANASTSNRLALIERPHESLLWAAGTSAYDFVSSILTAVGMRIWADEARTWHLADQSYRPQGQVTLVTGFNLYTATDTLDQSLTDASGMPLYLDSAVVIYTWTDASGNTQTAIDAYGPVGGATVVVNYSRAYPGPGAAKYLVEQRQNSGHSLDLTAAIDWSVTPGQPTSVTLPSTDNQKGFVSAVTWSLGTGDDMAVTTRGLISYSSGSWAMAQGQTWASGAGASWAQDI